MTNMDDVATAERLRRKPDDDYINSQSESQGNGRFRPDICCENGDTQPSCRYELKECFPCLFNPLQYFLSDRFPCVRWLGLPECCRWFPNFISWLAKKTPRFPAFDCQQVYNPKTAVSDAVAGLTVGLMVVPQALAYAKIAGLPIEVHSSSHYRAV